MTTEQVLKRISNDILRAQGIITAFAESLTENPRNAFKVGSVIAPSGVLMLAPIIEGDLQNGATLPDVVGYVESVVQNSASRAGNLSDVELAELVYAARLLKILPTKES